MKKRQSKRDRLFAKQRRERGWDDSETWSLDHSLAKLILPRLKRFREITAGHPGCLNSMEEWYGILDKMIAAFELEDQGDFWCFDKKQSTIVNRGLKLFAKWYGALWW